MEPNGVWGYLVPCCVEIPPIELQKTTIVAGRDPGSDVLLQGDQLGCKQESISKHHFRLVHSPQGVVLRDDSKSGTYINGRLIGRKQPAPVPHGARIDIIHPGIKAFVFLDKATSDGANFLQQIKNKYILGQNLGEGGFGQVFMVLDKVELKRYAMKMVKYTPVAKREAEILREIKHPCMIRAYEIFKNVDHLYLVLEYLAGGDLSRWVNDKKLLSEKQTKLLFYQLALAVQYMHQNSITHRDLKPANILLATNNPHTLIKVTDFGLAKDEDLHSDMTTCAGTEVYLAPEVMISTPYTNKVDIWSMGVILHYSLSGVLPFHSLNEAARLQHHVLFTADKWRYISLTALELVKRMLVKLPERRASINEVLAAAWLQDEPMKADAHSLMGLHIHPSPAAPVGRNLSPVHQDVPQVVRAKATAVSPARLHVATPPVHKSPSPAAQNRQHLDPSPSPMKRQPASPSPVQQNRQPLTPRGVFQYLSPNPGGDKKQAATPLRRVTPTPNRLTPRSPQRKDDSPAADRPYVPGRFAAAAAADIKPPLVHKAQKTFLVEARRNLRPAPWKP